MSIHLHLRKMFLMCGLQTSSISRELDRKLSDATQNDGIKTVGEHSSFPLAAFQLILMHAKL